MVLVFIDIHDGVIQNSVDGVSLKVVSVDGVYMSALPGPNASRKAFVDQSL